jgi:hypothetical protein
VITSWLAMAAPVLRGRPAGGGAQVALGQEQPCPPGRDRVEQPGRAGAGSHGLVHRLEGAGWILTSGQYDAVEDFARAVADLADPQQLNPAYNARDSLHPNDAGYQAIAAAINLSGL